jgi:hypothetical protein
MANDALTQQALASDPQFQRRVMNALCAVAWSVLDEAPETTGHTARAAYARLVLATPKSYAATLAVSLVTRTDIMAFTTAYDFTVGAVTTAATDADLETQFATDWTALSGA